MRLHFPLPKIRTFRFSLHTSRLRWNSQWVHTFRWQKISPSLFRLSQNGVSRAKSDWKPQTNDEILPSHIVLPIEKIIGSAEALPILCVRCTRCERERYREREREREKDGNDVTIVALKLAMSLHFPFPKSRSWRWRYTFHCKKFALFVSFFPLPVSPFLIKWSPLWRWNSQWILTFRCQKTLPSLFRLSQVARSFFPSKKWIKLIPKTIGNRKRDCVWGCARGINTTRENL